MPEDDGERNVEDREAHEAARRLVQESVWRPPDIHDEPLTELTAWSAREIPTGDRHLVGRTDREGRVSSPVVAWDKGNRTATTRSGRRYRLLGPPGRDADAEWVWSVWTHTNGIRSWLDVSFEFVVSGPDTTPEGR